MTMNLFDSLTDGESRQEQLGPGAMVLRKVAVPEQCITGTNLRKPVNLLVARIPASG
jgi:hypothetical protein